MRLNKTNEFKVLYLTVASVLHTFSYIYGNRFGVIHFVLYLYF